MELSNKEKEAIRDLELDLEQLQILEINIKSNDGRNPIQRLVSSYAIKKSLYDNPEVLKRLHRDLKIMIKKYVEQNNIKGRLMSKKTMDKFLEKSEMKDFTQRQLRIINQATTRQVKRRLNLAYAELSKGIGVFKADLDIFKKRAINSGLKDKEIMATLIKIGEDKAGIAQALAKHTKRVTVDAIRRERSAAEIATYSTKVPPNAKWVWITISSKPCPNCIPRSGVELTLARWESQGLPGSGRTICGASCKCKLRPSILADEVHKKIRHFNWDKDNTVLTTPGEARTFKAKSNQFSKGVNVGKKNKSTANNKDKT